MLELAYFSHKITGIPCYIYLCVFRMAKIVPVKLREPVITSGEEEDGEEDSYQPSWQGQF